MKKQLTLSASTSFFFVFSGDFVEETTSILKEEKMDITKKKVNETKMIFRATYSTALLMFSASFSESSG